MTCESTAGLNRRAALAGGAALTAATAGGAAMAARSQIGIGLQLYAIHQTLDQDFDGALKRVAEIGYKYVEYAGLHGRTPGQMRAAFDALGLKCPSAHFGPDDWMKGSQGPIDIAKALGASNVVCPMPPIPRRLRERAQAGAQTGLAAAYDGMTLRDWKGFAAFLNHLGEDAHKAGLTFAYHNHNIDFRPLEHGRTPIEIILHETNPRHVDLEVDLGWVAAAGHDPAAFLARHGGRITMVHLKDLKPTKPNFGFDMNPSEVGSGVIDWRRVFQAIRHTRVAYGFVEQEPPLSRPQLESSKISFDYLTKLQAEVG